MTAREICMKKRDFSAQAPEGRNYAERNFHDEATVKFINIYLPHPRKEIFMIFDSLKNKDNYRDFPLLYEALCYLSTRESLFYLF